MSKKEIKWQQCEAAWTNGTAVGENRKNQLLLFAETPTGKPISHPCKWIAGCWNDKPLGYPMPQQSLHINIFMLHWSVMKLTLTLHKLHQNNRKYMVVTFQYLAVHINILFETMVHQTNRMKSSALNDGKCNKQTYNLQNKQSLSLSYSCHKSTPIHSITASQKMHVNNNKN